VAKKLKVTLANNEIHHWTRPWWYFWIYDGFSAKTFRNEAGRIIKVTNRWVISIEDE
jgi:hypothetical protein